ncbi:hypothetical protein [Streptomyces sp. NPDC057910]|uniref:hypothetical protein n=1 Tax=Streptomyces sp. NPDC057910 TaxID=3346278 RepID=UPI0036E6021C
MWKGTLPERAGVDPADRVFEYTLVYDDGRTDYFSGAGDLIARADRFGNEIVFVWEKNRAGESLHRPVAVIGTYGQRADLTATAEGMTVVSPKRSDGTRPEMRLKVDGGRLPDFEGWAQKAERFSGNNPLEIYRTVASERHPRAGNLQLPEGYRGACATSAFVLTECLNGRPTTFAFKKDTPHREFTPEDRTRRLGEPVLEGASQADFRKYIAKQPEGSVFEFRGFSDGQGDSHAAVAVSPDLFYDVENFTQGSR